MNGTAITNRLQNSFKIKDNNLYGSSYYWNFRTSSFKQVACLILTSKHRYNMATSNKYKCTQTHSKFIWYVLLTYNKYISSNTLLLYSYFIYLSYLFKKKTEIRVKPGHLQQEIFLSIYRSFPVNLHLYLTVGKP